jgi:EAL domain-containing protein (putative c-di-GMP-specific phosphodiesterase class I)
LPMIPIAVNFAGATLRQIDVAEKMTALIEKYHVSCEYLEVEVSESYSDMNQEMLAETSNKEQCAGDFGPLRSKRIHSSDSDDHGI